MPNNRLPRLSGETPVDVAKIGAARLSQRLLPRGHAEVSGTDQYELSDVGQQQLSRPRNPTSALPPKADSSQTSGHVRFVPIALAASCGAIVTPE
jgi:hypothetical protein